MSDAEMEEKFRPMAQKHLRADRLDRLSAISPRHRKRAAGERPDIGYAGLITL